MPSVYHPYRNTHDTPHGPCANMRSSTKPEVQNISQRHLWRTVEPRPQPTSTEILWRLDVWFLRYVSRQTNILVATYFSPIPKCTTWPAAAATAAATARCPLLSWRQLMTSSPCCVHVCRQYCSCEIVHTRA